MTSPVHSYENEFPADVLPRGEHRGWWSGCYVVTDEGQHYVPTDVSVEGRVRVILTVTDELVSVSLALTTVRCDRNPAAEGERAAREEGVTFVDRTVRS